MTANRPRKTAGSDATVGGATIDQLIAQKIGRESLLPSLQLAVEDPNSSSSNCGEGYSCAYTNSISWVDLPTPENETVQRTSPLPMELNPQVVFETPVRQRPHARGAGAAHEATCSSAC